MINGKSVSLCMVIYNSADLAEKAIMSVLNVIDEIVIINQGSSPEESGKLERLSKLKDKSVYLVTTNKGNADYDRQYCYSQASCDFILAMDADEYIEEGQLKLLEEYLTIYPETDVVWFYFDNDIFYQDIEYNIKDILGDDPHPRLWRRLIKAGDQIVPTVVWPQEAHQFPLIRTGNILYSNAKFKHRRDLVNIVKTHLHRGKNISPEAQIQEKRFVKAVFDKFGNEIKKQFYMKFPELANYLKGV